MELSTAVYSGPYPFSYQRRLRWGEADPAKIAYTVRFVDLAMEAIEEWYIAVLNIDWYRLTTERNSGAPVVDLEFKFLKPLRPGNQVRVDILVRELRRTTITFAFSGWRDDQQLSFQGSLTACIIDASGDAMKAMSIPDEFRVRIEHYMAACQTHTLAKSQNFNAKCD